MLQVESKGSLPSSVAKRMVASEFADMMLDTHESLQMVGKSDLGVQSGNGKQQCKQRCFPAQVTLVLLLHPQVASPRHSAVYSQNVSDREGRGLYQ